MAFTVLSYNIQEGGDSRLGLIADTISRHRPDAVALLEVTSQANVMMLAQDLGMQLRYGEANNGFAIAWLSRWPFRRSRNHQLPTLAKTLLEVAILWEGMLVSLFATHLIHGRTAADAERRAVEVRAILDILSPMQQAAHALVGDFNAIHPEDSVGARPSNERPGYIARQPIELLLKAGYTDCYRLLHRDTPGYTYLAQHPWLRLDYIFATVPLAARLSACDVETTPPAQVASDHLPVWAEFR